MELVKVKHIDSRHQNKKHLKTSPIDCDGVQLTNAHTWVRYPGVLGFSVNTDHGWFQE